MMQGIAAIAILGLPGLLLGVGAGVLIRRWLSLLLLACGLAIAVQYGIQRIDAGSADDDDRGVIDIVVLVANFAGFLVGAFVCRLVRGGIARTS